jgi:hypothetical protein
MRLSTRSSVLGLALLVAGSAQPALAQAVRANAGFSSNTLAANDDGSTGLVNMGFTANFFGVTRTQTYVNNNGNITFDDPLATFVPFNLLSTSRQIIAPYFMDIDTRGVGSAQTQYGIDVVDGRAAFGVNWLGVGYYNSRADKLNFFQLVLLDRSDTGVGNFDFEFNYQGLLSETGSASGDVNPSDGLCQPVETGCSSARAGWSNGTDRSFELAGSGTPGALINGGANALISGSLNSSVQGRYLFNVRGGQVVSTVPEPSTVLLFGAGSLVLAGVARRRSRQR